MRELDPDVVERNYAKESLTRRELDAILKGASVEDVMNTRHRVAKENGWKDKPPSKSAFKAAALKEPNLLRRPVILRNGKAVVSRDERGDSRALPLSPR